jgi:hypothetical protein
MQGNALIDAFRRLSNRLLSFPLFFVATALISYFVIERRFSAIGPPAPATSDAADEARRGSGPPDRVRLLAPNLGRRRDLLAQLWPQLSAVPVTSSKGLVQWVSVL